MKRYLIITGYFIFFWIVIPVVIYFLSKFLDKSIFDGREISDIWLIPGCIIALCGFLMLLRTVYQFKRQSGEYPISATPPQKIIRRDVFIVWRHPIYLFASITLFGVCLALRSYSSLCMIFPAFMILVSLYVFREELILLKRFGKEYLFYRNIVNLVIPHLHQWLKIPGFIIFKICFRIKVKNKENIPESLPFFVISGHRHYFDPFIISYAVPCPLKHISTFEMFRNPVNRKIFTWFGAIPRRRFEKDISGLQKIIAALKNGYPICIFPEGGRSWTGQLRPFKPEALKLLKRFKDIPVLPVRIEGNYHSWPRWADSLMRSDITVTLEKPVFIDPKMGLEELQDFLLQMVKPRDEMEAGKACQSKNRINHLSKVIYRCPVCNSIQPPAEILPDTLKCGSCSSKFVLGSDFMLESYIKDQKKTESIHSIYNSIRIKYSDISSLLNEENYRDGKKYISQDEKLVYMAPGQLWIENKTIFVKHIKGLCVLSDKSLTITDNERSQVIPLAEIGAVTIESNYKLQIYNEIIKTLYQITFDNDSALKWQDILSCILENQYNKQIITR